MTTWLIPALKAVLPHIGTIIATAGPVFTKKETETTPNQTDLLQKQISELQAAAAQNATHVKELAEQLQRTVSAIEQAALVTKKNDQRALQFALAALVISASSLGAVVILALKL